MGEGRSRKADGWIWDSDRGILPQQSHSKGDLGKWLFRQIVNSLLPYRAPSISRPC